MTSQEPGPEAEPRIVHTIDGIAEYDHPMPRWWLTMFAGTIAFAAIYWVLMPSWFGPGLLHWSQLKRYEAEVKAADARAGAHEAPAASGAAGGHPWVQDPSNVAAGKALFAQNCAACHGADAHGLIGPNLVKPPYWVLGKGEPEDLEQIVTHGTAKGMPTWGPVLGPNKVRQVVAFVYGLEHPGGGGVPGTAPSAGR